MAGRKRASYLREYGPVEGAEMHTRLQRMSNLASQHAKHKKRLARKKNPPNAPGV